LIVAYGGNRRSVQRFRFIQVEGAPRERGRQVGEETADLIRFNLDNYWRLFHDLAGLDRSSVIEHASSFLEAIRTYAPHLLEEMRGIAEGAGATLVEIVALNYRTEFLSEAKVPLRNECTAVFAGPEATADGHTLLAQNWDWAEILRGGMILLQITQPGRPTILTLTEAGMVGKIGFNSAGIGVCTNFLLHECRRHGVPFHLILREALNATRLGVAVAAVYRQQRADSGNFLLAHADGEAINLEATPLTVAFQHPVRGLLIHTNHFLAPRLQQGDHGILESDNTLLRYGRARRLLKAETGRITVDTLKQVFQDHFNYPRAICRHSDPELPEAERNVTLASIIIDLTVGKAHVACGEPCVSPYYSIELTEFEPE
jgi:isopenicillin-N N-acyltransferase-like protein